MYFPLWDDHEPLWSAVIWVLNVLHRVTLKSQSLAPDAIFRSIRNSSRWWLTGQSWPLGMYLWNYILHWPLSINQISDPYNLSNVYCKYQLTLYCTFLRFKVMSWSPMDRNLWNQEQKKKFPNFCCCQVFTRNVWLTKYLATHVVIINSQ